MKFIKEVIWLNNLLTFIVNYLIMQYINFYGEMADKVRQFISTTSPGSGPHELNIDHGKKLLDRLYVMRNKGHVSRELKFKSRSIEGKLLVWRLS